MKHFTNFKGLFLLIAFTAISSFSFGQKYTGLTAAASDGTAPTVIFDGNYGSRWQDASNLDNASVVVNLGSVKNVNSIKIYWEGANAKAYTISFSTDNVNFTGDLNYTNLAAGARTDLISGLNVDCQYIKFQGVTRQLPYGYSIYEFEVYPAVTPVLTSLTVTPATSSIFPGETKQLTVGGLDQLGNNYALTTTTTWSVDGAGASVDANGLFSTTQKG
ncbi:MAG TPA: discoidin domain-containing protein, partial [Paludibacter sp.]|nr:discoidin domain-containing protein [Paludibacter sp.]